MLGLELRSDDGGRPGWTKFAVDGLFANDEGDLIVPGVGVALFRDFEYGTGANRPVAFGAGDLIRSAKDLSCEWLDLDDRGTRCSGIGDDVASRLRGLRRGTPAV